MSLNFAFLGDSSKFDDDDWNFFNNSLPWACMATDIVYICEESIDEFIYRCQKTRIIEPKADAKVGKDFWGEFKKDMKRFYGFRCNVSTESRLEWAKKHMVGWEGKSRNKTWADKIGKLAYSSENEKIYRELVAKEKNKEEIKKGKEAFHKL